MRISFTKMHGAGNDFVVLDETQCRLGLSAGQYRFLADRHFGVGCDQILSIRPAPADGVFDFEYVIHNADGGEVEHCGNGARCFVRYVVDRGLTKKRHIRVKVANGIIEPRLLDDGRVTVDMGAPVFGLAQIPFDAGGLASVPQGSWQKWPLALDSPAPAATVFIAALSMGNPHAVQCVDDVDSARVLQTGPLLERHWRFPRRVNAGFMQVLSRTAIRLRVYERGAGETLACGTGACAAAVAGMRWGLLDADVAVQMAGGTLRVAWAGQSDSPVQLTGPAQTLFQAEIDVPDGI
jgi:diaminopimelate epimerase